MTDMKTFSTLADLLRARLAVIADHELRERDPSAHLDKLRDASLALEREYELRKPSMPARLNHFMQQSSYQKALAFLDAADRPTTDGAAD